MRLQWPLLLLLGFGWLSCFPKTEGLKCYVCEMEDCRVEESKYLVDCGEHGIRCGSFQVVTIDPYSIKAGVEIWIQKICLYQVDLTCLGLELKDLSTYGHSDVLKKSPFFLGIVSCMNSNRKEKGHLLMEKPHVVDTVVGEGVKANSIHLFTCEEEGCNKGAVAGLVQRRVPITLAEGFPIDTHNKRKRNSVVSCYHCKIMCRKNFSPTKESSNEAYGCTMLSIYQIAGGMKAHDYFERGLWYPGDQWCLERSYNSTPTGTGRSLGNVQKANIQYLEGGSSGRGARCSNDEYSRALTGRELESGFEWIGHRKFYSPEEFGDYWNCRKHVTNKLKIDAKRPNPSTALFNVTAATAEWSGKSGVFAWVGFRFCGPVSFCNNWTETELYEKMKPENPPSTSTTLKPDSSTAPSLTTSTSAPTGGKDDDGCYKDTKNNKAPKIIDSFSTCFFLFALLQAGYIPLLQ